MDTLDAVSVRTDESREPLKEGNLSVDAGKKKRRRFLKVFLVFAGVILLLIGGAFATRCFLPARVGWELIPLKQNNVFAQNVIIWMTGRCYAQEPLVNALSAAGKILEKEIPGAGIAYLDASGRKGGKLLGHLSHKHGRDIDICFIGRDKASGLYPSRPQFMPIGYRLNYDRKGQCGSLTFDKKANLFLIMSLLEQDVAPVEKIFVEPYIESWLFEEAENIKLGAPAIRRLKNVLRYAGKNAAKHDDHLHVRFDLPQL